MLARTGPALGSVHTHQIGPGGEAATEYCFPSRGVGTSNGGLWRVVHRVVQHQPGGRVPYAAGLERGLATTTTAAAPTTFASTGGLKAQAAG